MKEIDPVGTDDTRTPVESHAETPTGADAGASAATESEAADAPDKPVGKSVV